jgi:hypothetical protein
MPTRLRRLQLLAALGAVSLGASPGTLAAQVKKAPANNTPSASICVSLGQAHAAAVKANDFVTAAKASVEYAAHGCAALTAPPVPAKPKACKQSIKNIATFLATCPTADMAYGAILKATPVSFDYVPVATQTLAQDVTAVCLNHNPPDQGGPSLKQRTEYRVVQALRTIRAMDGLGEAGCPYPWTNGASLHLWMTSLLGGIDIRDDLTGSNCCQAAPPGGTKSQIRVGLPSLTGVSPVDFQWAGVANTIALIAHETRHIPVPPASGSAFDHSTCCLLQQPGAQPSCDNAYQLSSLPPYGIQYWLFSQWLSGTSLNVGYGCAPDANQTQFFVITANGYIKRFCSTGTPLPPMVSAPAKPGGPCPK